MKIRSLIILWLNIPLILWLDQSLREYLLTHLFMDSVFTRKPQLPEDSVQAYQDLEG